MKAIDLVVIFFATIPHKKMKGNALSPLYFQTHKKTTKKPREGEEFTFKLLLCTFTFGS
jgi:hypothetical protein